MAIFSKAVMATTTVLAWSSLLLAGFSQRAAADANANADTGAGVAVAVDVKGPQRPFDPLKLTKCFGSGHATLALRDTWRRQLLQVQSDLGTRSVRFHGLLDDDMSAVLEDGSFSFANILNVFDFFVGNSIQPIVELSFMPELYASGKETIFHYKGNITPPKSYEKWAGLIGALLDALIDRYGPAELSTWRFEVWNEPNCGFWTGNQTEYFKLYNYTAHAVRSRGTFLRVGGPATCQVAWLKELADFVAEHKVPLDFLSTHLYPTDPNVPVRRTGFDEVIRNASRLADSVGVPLVMTEFNCGLGIDCADAPYAAAFVVHVAQQIQDMPNLDTLSYWTFTDIFEEGGQVSAPFNQQFGIQTHQGIPKPVYRALQAIAGLHSAQLDASLPSGTVDAIVTTDGKGVKAVFANWNYHQLPIQAETVTVTLSNAPGAPKEAVLTVIDDAHAYAVPLWEQMGKPTYPSAQQVNDLIAASQVRPSPVQAVAGPNGTYSFNFTAQPMSVTALSWTW